MPITPKIPLSILVALVPTYCFAIIGNGGNHVQLGAQLVSFLNLVLFLTSIACIKQFFWPGNNNRLPFHIFNIIFTILFYCISIPFLILNREYYENLQDLTPLGVAGKFFFSLTIDSFAQWVIIGTLVINVLYIRKYYRDYFEAGIVSDT